MLLPDRKQHDQYGYPVMSEVMHYTMRFSEKMPAFNFWPRGREIIHRLIMRAAMAENLNEF